MKNFFYSRNWRFIDQSLSAKDRSPLESFAMDDTLCHITGQNLGKPTIRTWVHNHSVVLGIQDHRLPFIEEGMELLQTAGYTPIVRNSGGLAVVLDCGVMNVSIVVSDDKKISIDQGFEQMVNLIKMIFPEVADKIEAYEIVGSYCPGTYDLSIGGQKFAGISQRRMKNGIAVQIYLCVEGSGSARAQLIKQFYDSSLKDGETKFTYPDVEPHVMASLEELIDQPITVAEVNTRIQHLLLDWHNELDSTPLQQHEIELYTFYLERIFKRNESLLK